ncbi:MAG: hypothetical protein WKG07_16290 [Hymenobacter sp.]
MTTSLRPRRRATLRSRIFTDLALHEKIHADFLKTALGANAIKALDPRLFRPSPSATA